MELQWLRPQELAYTSNTHSGVDMISALHSKILQGSTKDTYKFIAKQWQETEHVHMTPPTQSYIADNSVKC